MPACFQTSHSSGLRTPARRMFSAAPRKRPRRQGRNSVRQDRYARRRIPMTQRVQAILEMRLSSAAGSEWVFPAATRSGHIEPSTVTKQHAKAIGQATAILRKQTGRKKMYFSFRLFRVAHIHNPDGHPTWIRDRSHTPDTAACDHRKQSNSSARAHHPRSEGSRRSGKQRAYFKAYRTRRGFQKYASPDANYLIGLGFCGAPGVIRTPDLLVRSYSGSVYAVSGVHAVHRISHLSGSSPGVHRCLSPWLPPRSPRPRNSILGSESGAFDPIPRL